MLVILYRYLKLKVTLHCYYIHFFWVLCVVFEMCLIHIKVQLIIHVTVEFYVFAAINSTVRT